MIWPQERSREALDGLLVLARVAARSRGERVPAVVSELLEALAADTVSVRGNGSGAGGMLVDMSKGLSADEAGARVGLTGRRVRQLCAAGLVAHTLFDGRYVVDVDDLHRHLRQAS